MALNGPERSPVEIWTGRFWRFVYVVVASLVYLALFAGVLVPFRELGYFVTPFVVLLYWRLVSYLVTGEQFRFRLTASPSDTGELFSVIFSVFFSLNLLLFYYHLLTWYDVNKGH